MTEKKTKTKKHLSLEDKKYWEILYEFVRSKVMNYDENQSLSKNMVLRLKGLSNNKFMANNNIEDSANYSFKVILNTFKYCMPSIQNAISNNSFKDENHKFNYVLKIIDSNLNTVYMKMKNAEKSEDKIEVVNADHVSNYTNTFKSKESISNKSNKFDDLW